MYVLLFISGLPNQSKSEVPTRRSRSASQWGMMGSWLRMGIWLRMRTRRCFTWNFRRECFTVESPTQTLYDKFLSMIFVHLGQKKKKISIWLLPKHNHGMSNAVLSCIIRELLNFLLIFLKYEHWGTYSFFQILRNILAFCIMLWIWCNKSFICCRLWPWPVIMWPWMCHGLSSVTLVTPCQP